MINNIEELRICIRCMESKKLTEQNFYKYFGIFDTICRKCRIKEQNKKRRNKRQPTYGELAFGSSQRD